MDETKALKNHSMLEEERMDDRRKISRTYRIKSWINTYAPVGHVYSIMMEEMNIKNPDIHGFIAELKKLSGSELACINDPTTPLYSKTASALRKYLHDKVQKGEISKKSFRTIMFEAHGGWDYDYIIDLTS